jgi:hypothetical protein
MIDRIRRWVHELFEKRHHVVLFVPSRDHGPRDPVETISSILPRLCEGSLRCARVDPKPAHFGDVPELGKVSEARSIVLFAHPVLSFVGFAANGLLGAPGETLTPSWWRGSEEPYEMIVAHVCHGKKVLDSQIWRETFPAWVSYDVSIDAMMVTARAERLWGEIAKAIVDASLESRSAQSLAERIHAAYLSKIADLRDSGVPEDVVHIIHFQQAMDGLVFSKERE